jgi:hypothetical protein
MKLARYLDPTILYNVSWSDQGMEDEIFGPILPVLPCSDLGKLLANYPAGRGTLEMGTSRTNVRFLPPWRGSMRDPSPILENAIRTPHL